MNRSYFFGNVWPCLYLAHFSIPLAPGISFLGPCLAGTVPLSYFPRTSLSAKPQLERLFARTWEVSRLTLPLLVFYPLRSRGATSAAYNGVSDSVFQWLGRWRSVLAKDVYRWWPRKKAFSFLGSRSFHLSFHPIFCHSTYFVGLVLAKPSQNKLICHYVLSVDVV